MTTYVIKRLVQAIPTLLGVVVLVFFFVRALPGDPARLYVGTDADLATVAAAREQFGLDRSLPEQFVFYVRGLTQGNLGQSFRARLPAVEVIGRHFRATLVLASIAISAATLLGVLLGVAAALRRGSLVDLAITSTSILGISTPPRSSSGSCSSISLPWNFAGCRWRATSRRAVSCCRRRPSPRPASAPSRVSRVRACSRPSATTTSAPLTPRGWRRVA